MSSAKDIPSWARPPEEKPKAAAEVRVCPHCQEAGSPTYLFCEHCGYDFTTGALPRPLREDLAVVDTRVERAFGPPPGARQEQEDADEPRSWVSRAERASVIERPEPEADQPEAPERRPSIHEQIRSAQAGRGGRVERPARHERPEPAPVAAEEPAEEEPEMPRRSPAAAQSTPQGAPASEAADPAPQRESAGERRISAEAAPGWAFPASAERAASVARRRSVIQRPEPEEAAETAAPERRMPPARPEAAPRGDAAEVPLPPRRRSVIQRPEPEEPPQPAANEEELPDTTPITVIAAPEKAPAEPRRRPAVSDWVVEIWVDSSWYEVQESDESCPSPGLPEVVQISDRALVGRYSASRGISPDIECGTDSGVSRRHAEFFTDGTRWWVEDLGSSNGTYVGQASGPLPEEPIPAGQRVEVSHDDRIYVGAWTRLVVRRATAADHAATGRLG
ncbi:FHA domain-containing protein [Austwickia chelonae]|uniref:FHA domain-containing protein n=1 Tax=Austwickia chelonae TaxID=100225 RepID=UPI001F07E570|nr:FHA domain-containing protein [Austwickia chelonae]